MGMQGMGAASIFSTVAGGVVKSRSASDVGAWNSAMADYEGVLARHEAIIEESKLRRDADVNKLLRLRDEKKAVGNVRAVAGTSGIASDSGSTNAMVKDIIKEYELQNELERQSVEYDAKVIKYQADVSVALSKAKKEMAQYETRAKKTEAILGSVSTVLGDSSSMFGSGVFGGKKS